MAINFPSSPVNGQVHTEAGGSWIFNSTKGVWETSMGGTLAAHTHTFASLTSKPTTIAGYGITDFNSLGDARWSLLAHVHTFASLTSKPTTIAGYGITDFNSLGDARWSLLGHVHTFASLTSKPTTLAGYGITDGGGGGVGSVVAVSHVTNGTAAGPGSTQMPLDNTIPQITEGAELMVLAHTPLASANLLRIDVVVSLHHSAAQTMSMALFRAGTNDALAAVAKLAVAGEVFQLCLTAFVVAGSTSALTFSVRVGQASATGVWRFNTPNAGAAAFGGVLASTITITEIKG